MQALTPLADLLQTQRRIVLVSHANPDGDAMGSSLALYHYFKGKGHQVSVVLPTDMPDFLDWMPGCDRVCIYARQFAAAVRHLQQAEILFVLDFNDWARLEQMSKLAEESKAFKVLIDHHLHPKIQADWTHWRTQVSSTCELVYEFLQALEPQKKLPAEVMDSIFVGIVTDTGRFAYSTYASTYRVAGDLVEMGLDDRSINDRINNSSTLKRFRLMALGLHERVHWWDDIHTAVLAFSLEDHQKYQIERGDTEGLANMLLTVKSVRLAILLTEQKDGLVKLSLRSKGNFSVQEICAKHFGGGGHLNASGASFKGNLSDLLPKLKALLHEEYAGALQT